MHQKSPHLAVTGAAMDVRIPKKRGKKTVIAGLIFLVLAAGGGTVWHFMPKGLQVAQRDVRIAPVSEGILLDEITVRGSAEPLKSVILDSVESGRVEEVAAKDGALVEKGELLFRLSNPQRNLELLERQAEHAQQISNLSTLRVAEETSRTEHTRRLSALQFSLSQAEKAHARSLKLAQQGFISAVALDESADALAQRRHEVDQEMASIKLEQSVRRDATTQLGSAIKGLQSGLQLVSSTVDALAVRAPVAGRLTGFRLQVGETVKTDQHIGRVDDPVHFKLSAQVDEFYLSRVAIGRAGTIEVGKQEFAVSVATIYPQIKNGRFTVELNFSKGQPAGLSPGQSLDVRIRLGEPATALILPNASFINDTGGAWVFAVSPDGKTAQRRAIGIGRRNNSQIEVVKGLKKGENVIVSSYAPFGKAEVLELDK